MAEAAYRELLSLTRPRVIKTEAENERGAAELEALDILGRPPTREEDALAVLLTVLAREVEQSCCPLGPFRSLDFSKLVAPARAGRTARRDHTAFSPHQFPAGPRILCTSPVSAQ
jgi:hypothetical protein